MIITLNFSNLAMLISMLISMILFVLVCRHSNKQTKIINKKTKEIKEMQRTINNLQEVIQEQMKINEDMYHQCQEINAEYNMLAGYVNAKTEKDEDKDDDEKDVDSKFTN